jgi:transposase-like protein
LKPDEIAALLDAYSKGATIDSLAEAFRIDRVTVMKIRDRAHAPRRWRSLEDHIAEASRLYQGGSSLATLGERFGVDAETVRRALLSTGMTLRPRRGWHYG